MARSPVASVAATDAPGASSCLGKPPSGPAGAASTVRPASRAARVRRPRVRRERPDTASGEASGSADLDAPAACGGASRSISSIGVASATWPPYSPTLSEIAAAVRGATAPAGQRMGEPEKPGPMPVASTAGPDTRTSRRGPLRPAWAPITSRISTSNCAIWVPRTTDRAVHLMPGLTSDSGMIGSAACAAGASAIAMRAGRTARRSKRLSLAWGCLTGGRLLDSGRGSVTVRKVR